MKKLSILLMISLAICQIALSQNVGINSTGAAPVASAMLDIASTTTGLLIPRVALTAINAAGPITSPATSLLVYNTATAGTAPNNVVPGYYYWTSTAWAALSPSASNAWLPTGNSGTTAGTNFIGTIDAVDLVVKTNSIENARFTSSGNVGIGTSIFDGTHPEKLIVNAGSTSSVNAIVGKGSLNNYLQLNIQNQLAGTSSSSDVVATADNGSETTYYVDMGINSSANTSGNMGAANDAYLYNIGQNLLMGTGTAAKSLVFMTGGTTQSTNERMRIDGTGNVGVGTNSPTFKFDVNGAINTGKASTTNGSLVFSNSTNANALTFNSGITSGSYALTLPVAQGAANTMLTNDGTGLLTWATPASAGGWVLNGNSVPSLKTLGTITNFDLPIITNNIERMRVNIAGNVGIGTSTFDATFPEKFLVNGGVTTSVNAIAGKGTINSYLQLNIQNQSTGTGASSDVVATADNGTETTNYVDMGINSSTNTSGVMGAADDAYLYNIGQNFLLGTGTAAKSLVFMTGGTTQSTNERMRIDGTGNVGVGTNSPTFKFDVNGAIHTGKASSTTGSLVYSNSTNANILTYNSGVTSASYTLTLPTAQGAANTMMTNDGTGVLTWATPSAPGSAWLLNGNTIGALQTFGTTSNKDLPFITNSLERMRIDNTGNVGIGTSTFTPAHPEKFYVNAGTTTSFNAIAGKGIIDNYLQLNIQNQSATANASSDVVATADNGNESSNYVNMGINSSANTSGAMGAADDAYLYNIGQNLLIGTGTPAMSLVFMTGGTAQATNERMRIDGTGDVAIGTATFDSTNPEQLVVDAGVTTSVNAIVGKGSINGYIQLNIQNQSNGFVASSDVVATADNGNESTNFVDMGINSSGNTSGNMGGINDAYLFNQGNNLLIGTGTAAKSLIFMTGGQIQSTNERLRIDGSGNVGIGDNNPGSTLSVGGSLKMKFFSSSGGAYTILATDNIIINTGAASNWTILAATTVGISGRIYRLVNQGTGTITLSKPVTTASGVTTTLITAGTNFEIISDGTVWRKIN